MAFQAKETGSPKPRGSLGLERRAAGRGRAGARGSGWAPVGPELGGGCPARRPDARGGCGCGEGMREDQPGPGRDG